MHELQLKQADRQAKEFAAAKDRQTLGVLKRCIDYLARAGLPFHNAVLQPHCNRKVERAMVTALLVRTYCSEPSKGARNISRSWGRRCQGS